MIEEHPDCRSTLGVQFDTFSYRHAEEILNSKLVIKQQIAEVIGATKEIPVKQGADGLTAALMTAFVERKWAEEVPVSDRETHEQRFDLFKDRVAIEIEFTRYEFLYRDYFRFLSAYNADKIDVGVIITHAETSSERLKHPSVAPSFIRVKEDFAWLRPSLTVPIWVIALK